MSGYYDWQRQQANERVAARLAEAEAHRRAKEGRSEGGISIRTTLLVPALLGVIVLFLILNGCSPAAGTSDKMESAVREVSVVTMADRIQFQDARDIYYRYDQGKVVSEGSASVTMANRIHFQDARDMAYAYAEGTAFLDDAAPMTMAERLRFHDSILEKNQ